WGELAQALGGVGALAGEVVEPLLLRLVLLARERVHLAELLAPAFEALELRGELVAVAVVDRLRARCIEAALCAGALRIGAGELDVERAQPLGLLGPEAAKLGAELGRPGRFGPGRKRRLETGHVRGQTLDESESDTEVARGVAWRRRRRGGGAALQLGELGSERAAACLELEQERLRGLAGEPELAPL